MIVAVTMVRDEADVIGSTVARMLAEVDAVVVADNLSTDETREILEVIADRDDRLLVVDDPDPAYQQSAKMTALAQLARSRFGATWIVPFDADEVWYSPFGRIADVLSGQIPDAEHVVPAPLYDHVATALDPDDPDPLRRIGWRRREPNPLPKVAARWRHDLRIHQGNHAASYEAFTPALFDPLLVVRHFPYRSVDQFLRKVRNGAAAYRAAGDTLPASFGAHWRQWGNLLDAHGPDAVAEIFRKWYWRADPEHPLRVDGETLPVLFYDPAPPAPPRP